MKRLKDAAIQCLAANYEGSDLGQALADLRRYKTALRRIAIGAGTGIAEPAWEIARRALDDDEKAAT